MEHRLVLSAVSLVADINTQGVSLEYFEGATLDGKFYFSGWSDSPEVGNELWVYDPEGDGTATLDPEEPGTDLKPLFELLLKHVPPPTHDPDHPLQAQVTNLDASPYVGRLALCRVHHGTLRRGQSVAWCKRDGTVQQVSNPSRLPPVETIEEFREPIMACKIFVPQEYVGPVITLCTEKRGAQTNMHYSARHVVISYDLPLNEVVLDFFDRLKSMTRGYGSLDYEFKEYRAADMVRLDILVNGEKVDALSSKP
jgi:translation elongation factor EF-4